MAYFVLLLTSFLFGGMLLFSVGFGALSFKFLEPAVARSFIRKTFPYFYGYVLGVSALVMLLSFTISKTAAALAFFIFSTTLPTSKILMPHCFVIYRVVPSSFPLSHIFKLSIIIFMPIIHRRSSKDIKIFTNISTNNSSKC